MEPIIDPLHLVISITVFVWIVINFFMFIGGAVEGDCGFSYGKPSKRIEYLFPGYWLGYLMFEDRKK